MSTPNPIQELEKRFNPQAAQNLAATYLFQISGKNGGNWLARINKGNLSITPADQSPLPAHDCSISITAEDLELIIAGKLSAMTAAMSGILSVDGELGLAMQLVPVFFNGRSQIL